jgi:hemoglobin
MSESTPQKGSIIAFTGASRSVYELIGGMETFRRLAEAFYNRIDADPFLRPMFPRILSGAKERQALFLAQFFGGPTTYSERRGHPRLRMRHRPFDIGRAERDAWVNHMIAAMEEVGIEEPAYTTMRRYFEDAGTFLINREENESPSSE